MIALTKYGLLELSEKLKKAAPCSEHGDDDNMVICPYCREVACRLCHPMFCQCENDE